MAPARFAGFAGLAACALLASCAIEVTEPCPAGAQPALAVSPTGADGRLCAATVLVEEVEGSYSETLVPDDGCVHKGALDRPGLYKVVVSAPGYRTQTLWPDASDTQCGHSKTFAVTVTMAPELSLP